MKPPLCRCGSPAEYSVCVLVSSLGLRPPSEVWPCRCSLRRLYTKAPVRAVEDAMLPVSRNRSETRIQRLPGAQEQNLIRTSQQNVLLIEDRKLGRTSRR